MCLFSNGSSEANFIMRIVGMDAIHQSIKVVFNLLGWLDDDPAARDHKIHLLRDVIRGLFQGCSG